MSKSFWSKGVKFNLHSPGTGIALVLLVITQIPDAIKTSAEVACIAEVSNKVWRKTNTHKNVNVIAVKTCNGRN